MNRKTKGTLMARFEGPDGNRHRVTAIAAQQIVQGNLVIAEELNAAAELRRFEPGNPV